MHLYPIYLPMSTPVAMFIHIQSIDILSAFEQSLIEPFTEVSRTKNDGLSLRGLSHFANNIIVRLAVVSLVRSYEHIENRNSDFWNAFETIFCSWEMAARNRLYIAYAHSLTHKKFSNFDGN